ncbi:hypothetical protein RZS08_22995, partial [Arthrospira platensis SPKY1]|nr:hypothetical protein [Arthrospira platensis SPKY1]
RGRMVGRTKWPLAPVRRIEAAFEREQRRALDRLVLAHCRQQARQALREHGFSGAGRAEHHDRVRTGRRHLERATRLQLAAHVSQVGHARPRSGLQGGGRLHRQCHMAIEVGAHGEQAGGRQHPCARGERRLGGVVGRQHQCPAATRGGK